MNKIYIAFGSNIGDSMKTIYQAFAMMEREGMQIVGRSSVYETEPYGYVDQPNFVNGIVEVDTVLSCREVLTRILDIEQKLGRIRKIHWGPRVIDLDIIFFNEEIYHEEDLVVPHPDLHNRGFVLTPLTDLCPEYIHPILNKSVLQLLTELEGHPKDSQA